MRSFFHIASASNTIGARTIIGTVDRLVHHEEQILTICAQYGRASAIVPRFDVLNPHFTAVQFVYGLNRWTIVNLDGSPMPPGAAFAVGIQDVATFMDPPQDCFVHRASRGNTRDVVTYLELPLQFNLAEFERNFPGFTRQLLLFITPRLPPLKDLSTSIGWTLPPVRDLVIPDNWVNPPYREDVSVSASINHPVGVWWDEKVERWAIFNADFQPMSLASEFNVSRLADTRHGSSCEHYTSVVATGREGSAQRFCLMPCEGGFTFFVAQNPSFRYSRCLSQFSAERHTTPAFCTSPVAVSVIRRGEDFRSDELSIVSQDGANLIRGCGFSVVHLNDDTEYYSP